MVNYQVLSYSNLEQFWHYRSLLLDISSFGFHNINFLVFSPVIAPFQLPFVALSWSPYHSLLQCYRVQSLVFLSLTRLAPWGASSPSCMVLNTILYANDSHLSIISPEIFLQLQICMSPHLPEILTWMSTKPSKIQPAPN